MNPDIDSKKVLKMIVERTSAFLKEEVSINVTNAEYSTEDAVFLKLRHITSIISVEEYLKMTIAFSYDLGLITKMFENYTIGLSIGEEEKEMYLEETSGDIINIVIGNILSQIYHPKTIHLSTPVIISEAKSVVRYKDASFLSACINTQYGTLSIFSILPNTLNSIQLNRNEE